MATQAGRAADFDWVGDMPDDWKELTMEDDNFLDDDPSELTIEEEEEEILCDPEPHYKTYTVRQRIEIAREERWLESAMSDFDEFDQFENFDDYYSCSTRFSH